MSQPVAPELNGEVVKPEICSASDDQSSPQPTKALALAMESSSDIEGSVKSRSKWRTTVLLLALLLQLSLFVAALDATIVATSASVIADDLKSASGYVWIGGAYLLADAASGPTWAKVSDITGRKVILLVAVAIFFVSSIICATARTMPTLITGRSIQGLGGGAIILLVHISISDLFSMRQRSFFMGLCECVWAAAGAIGPIIGGLFTSLISWRYCFWINLPIAGLAFLILLFFFDTKHDNTSWSDGLRAIDWYGMITFLGFAVLILVTLNFGPISSWNSPMVIAMFVIGGALFFAFIYSEYRLAKFPIIPLRLFKNRSNVACCCLGFSHGMCLIAADYFLPLFFQSALQATPLRSGVLLLPTLLTTSLGGLISGITIKLTGRYLELIWIGSIFLCAGTGSFISFDMNSPIAQIIGCQILFGLGSGLLIEPPIISIQTSVSQQDVASAISTFTFIRSVSLAVSIVVGGVVFNGSMQQQHDYLSQAGLPADILGRLSGKEAAANVHIASQLADRAQVSAVKQAFSSSISNMFKMYTGFAVCALISGLFVRWAFLEKKHVETVTGIKKEG
ncbi:unnamed protein product [Clonostachys byssicola]|uniref:Major facilitator superfamily (MFS) profile domain-containing protein n=1 Tax=Clonostachys byssicola TaxID=160290 RepID=A0A9N9Y1Y6_9HYPO|nr:unnamed protein product [Clonostachys byssicola]